MLESTLATGPLDATNARTVGSASTTSVFILRSPSHRNRASRKGARRSSSERWDLKCASFSSEVAYTPGTAGSGTDADEGSAADARVGAIGRGRRRPDRPRGMDRSGTLAAGRVDTSAAIDVAARSRDGPPRDPPHTSAFRPPCGRALGVVGDGSRARPGPVVTVAAVGAVTSMTG